MNTAVAIAGTAGHTIIVLAAIHYGVKGLALLMPQLRVSAPPRQAAGPDKADDKAAPAAPDKKILEAA